VNHRGGAFGRSLLLALVLFPTPSVGGEVAAAPEARARAWIGVFLGEAVDGGAQLVAVVPGGPADRAGLIAGDVVLRAGEIRIEGVGDLTERLETTEIGQPLEIELLRTGTSLQRVVRPEGRPSASDLVSTFVHRRSAGQMPPRPARPDVPPPPAAPGVCCPGYGIRVVDVTPDLRVHFGAPADAGVLVTGVDVGRSGEGNGLRVGDVLVRLDERPLRQASEVRRLMRARRSRELAVVLVREGKTEVRTLCAGNNEAAAEATTEAAARSDYERALELEIERLERRLEELKRRLEDR
jgi:predicted metalloprotease with PDZ domain